MAILIDDAHFNEILSEPGFPVLAVEDFGFTAEDVKELCIYPALRDFFTYNPIKKTQSYTFDGSSTIPFPSDKAFGVIEAKAAAQNYDNRFLSTNPLRNPVQLARNRYGGRSITGARLPASSYGRMETQTLEDLERKTYINLKRAGRVDIDYEARTVTIKGNYSGELIIEWAYWSDDFASVRFGSRSDVIRLARAFVMRMIGMLRGQQNSNDGVDFNYDMLLSRADKLEEDVMNKWRSKAKPVVIR